MEFIYIIIGVVIGVVAVLFLGVDSISKKFTKREKEFDDKNE